MTKRKKAARSIADVKLPPWTAVSFADLHMSARTLDRCLRVLRGVRALVTNPASSAFGAFVVFCGDFWDLRGSLPLRQLDPLLDEFQEWERAQIQAVWIPGNHDQVTGDGLIHGIRVFGGFRGFTVATEPVFWPERKIAFLPWREDPAEQAALFDLESTGVNDWTIFAHAEVEGATTNYAHRAAGRVTLAKIQSVARACYLGHYHKRQKLGDRTFYIGNAYEKDFGEMGDPKGIAVIREDAVDPTWVETSHEFPRHHRIVYGTPFDVNRIEAQDIVELYAPPSLIGSEELGEMQRALPARDVRPLPLKTADSADAPPAFALTLDEAIDEFVDEMAREADQAGTDLIAPPFTMEDLKNTARALLAELPEAKAIQPMHPRVELVSVRAINFCALLGEVAFELRSRGLVLLRGPICVGKTALTDAITWALYGQTSPRKAGSSGSTFRGDEVIHDIAQECEVEVVLALGDMEVTVTREKKRGKGAKVHIEGVDMPDGISDTQDLIDRVVGLDYVLWRTCVSLGQGSVGSFATDADKARKELLSNAFGLNACAVAQKAVRTRLKPLRFQVDKIKMDVGAERRVISELEAINYDEQSAAWGERKRLALEAAQSVAEQARAAIATCDEHLAGEAQWLARKTEHEAHIVRLTEQLGQGASGRLSDLERQYGASEAEYKMLEGQLTKASIEHARLEKAYEANPAMPCPTCGQAMPHTSAEHIVAAKAADMERIERGMSSHKQRMDNLEAEMHGIRATQGVAREQIQQQIEESRAALTQIGQALTRFTQLRSNRQDAERRLAEATTSWKQHEASENPWEARQSELRGKLDVAHAKVADLLEQGAALDAQRNVLEFWELGFGPKGLPVLVLRTALHELELHANRFLGQLLAGRIFCQLAMSGDALTIRLFEQSEGEVYERRYEQLSGGQRRCVELAFSPFALSEMIFARCGVRVPLLIIDELTTHLGAEEKPLAMDLLRRLDRETVLVIDHDGAVQGEFDVVYEVEALEGGTKQIRRAS